jgi:[acyl-carrier-protein] S-malonyltransferase
MTATVDAKTAFAFPGVGVKLCGREYPFFCAHEDRMAPYLAEASTRLDCDLTRALADNQVDGLSDRQRQFFTYAYCAGVHRVLDEGGVRPAMHAGYSFGIYAALFAAGAVSFTDGLAMLDAAYQLMHAQCDGGSYGMGVVIGLREEDVAELLNGARYRALRQVNTNHDVCHVLAGARDALADLFGEAKQQGALTADLLDVQIPYHHPEVLHAATPLFRTFLEKLAWRDAARPVVSSIDQRLLTRPPEFIDFVSRNLSSPISWRNVVLRLHGAGVAKIIECGPGISLTQNGRFMCQPIQYVNIKTIDREFLR